MMDEDYKHWIYINRATTNSNDSTVEQKFTCILKCYKRKDVYISYGHASVYISCVYIHVSSLLSIQGGSKVYIPKKLCSKFCNIYLVVSKKWG